MTGGGLTLTSPPPEGDHPLWATQSSNTRSGTDTYRCKECHGWDYLGKDGAYGSGSHYHPVSPACMMRVASQLMSWWRSCREVPTPPMTSPCIWMMIRSIILAVFIQGLRDYRPYIDYASNAPVGGDAANGKMLFERVDSCQDCHGLDGTESQLWVMRKNRNLSVPFAVDNPQEFMHKVIYGQPASRPRMVAMLERGWTVDEVVDILAYAQSLPTGMEPTPAVLPQAGGTRLFDLSLILILSGLLILGAGLLSRRVRTAA